ncbi:unnamed protein product [Albugo candida]|uniref:Uncharacterized protein n=1 Tax=Albugo candida TaxID=65357 RepID=A0A024G8Z1_9STRA|nr:unnamed protein product [Albugo candida]|eukprot:CCI43000.1 unnamed protein product [Albugo candida]
MIKATSIGAATSRCALSDQIQSYRTRNFTPIEESKTNSLRGLLNKQLPTLVSLCIGTLSANFESLSQTHGLGRQFMPQLLERLPLDLDIRIATKYVADQRYWKRRCMSQKVWSENTSIVHHGQSWKQLHLEKYLQHTLQNFDAQVSDFKSLLSTTESVRNYIFSLEIEQLLSHLDLNEVCGRLCNLTRLCVTFGAKKVGMKYDRMLFGMKSSDARTLSHYFKVTDTLTTLCLPNNSIDDELLRMLMAGLMNNKTITMLNLSHNKIGDGGARVLARLLGPDSILTCLDLYDNHISASGGEFLGQGLEQNTSLCELNLRLNRLTDKGGHMLAQSLIGHNSIKILDLSNNQLEKESAESLATVIANPKCTLRSIDLSGNLIKEENVEFLLQALQQNTDLISLDLRQNQISASASCLVQVARILRINEMTSSVHARSRGSV